MPLERLKIQHLRNIYQASLHPSPRLNLIIGPNASGKTSLLEAIALICQGRSFRTTRIDQLISHDQRGFSLLGSIFESGRRHTLGLSREEKKTRVKLDGNTLTRTTDMINVLPVHVITPESHEILDLGPKMRREYLDWGVFHVKPNYLSVWQRYHRILRQRNQVLRQGGTMQAIQAWDGPLLVEAQQLNAMREAYLAALSPMLSELGEQLLECTVEFDYRPGWPKSVASYAAQLKFDLEKDRERGFTQSGPHRADISLRADGRGIKQIFSRGQQKLLICAMYLAQVSYSGKPGVLLIDDLAAELDPLRRQRLLTAAYATHAQLFVTATEPDLVSTEAWIEKKVFHVEHGEFSEVV